MRVEAARVGSYASGGAAARRTGGASFLVPQDESPASAAAAGAPRPITSLGSILTLQAVEDPLERRRRAVKRGSTTLDVLEEIKLALLSGDLDAAAVARLRNAAEALRERSGDPGLDAVLAPVGQPTKNLA